MFVQRIIHTHTQCINPAHRIWSHLGITACRFFCVGKCANAPRMQRKKENKNPAATSRYRQKIDLHTNEPECLSPCVRERFCAYHVIKLMQSRRMFPHSIFVLFFCFVFFVFPPSFCRIVWQPIHHANETHTKLLCSNCIWVFNEFHCENPLNISKISISISISWVVYITHSPYTHIFCK